LLEAAVGVFAAKGLKRVTVDDLVGAAGFTRGAFYSNYDSVEEVFFEVFSRAGADMLSAARGAVASVPSGEFDLVALGAVLDSLDEPGGAWLTLHHEATLLALRDDRARDLVAGFSREIRGQVVDVIDDVLVKLGRRASVPTAQIAEVVIAVQFRRMTLRALGDTTLGGGAPGEADASGWLRDQVLPGLLASFSEPVGA
jgi:AcrR family transcriptional regulator